jgi:hypothetical protein
VIGTLVAEAYDALEQLLRDDTELTATGVKVYAAREDAMEREAIVLGNADGEQESAAIGNRRRNDPFTIVVHVNVQRQEGIPAVRRRCIELAQHVERILGATPDLGLPPSAGESSGVLTALPKAWRLMQNPAADKGNEVELRLNIEVTTRIRTR